jgi:hypothetical protein
VHADLAAGLRQRIVAGEDRTAVAVAAQRLAGEEAGAAEAAEVAAPAALVAGAEALRRVLDHRDVAVACGDGVDLVHVGHLAVQAHRHDGPRARRDLGLDAAPVDVAGAGLDVDEHRRGAEQHDHLGGGGEAEGRGDDLVARLQLERHQRDQQRLGAAGDGDAMLGAAEGCEPLLQLLDLRAHDVLAVVEHRLHARGDAVLQRGVLRLEVDEIELVRHTAPSPSEHTPARSR